MSEEKGKESKVQEKEKVLKSQSDQPPPKQTEKFENKKGQRYYLYDNELKRPTVNRPTFQPRGYRQRLPFHMHDYHGIYPTLDEERFKIQYEERMAQEMRIYSRPRDEYYGNRDRDPRYSRSDGQDDREDRVRRQGGYDVYHNSRHYEDISSHSPSSRSRGQSEEREGRVSRYYSDRSDYGQHDDRDRYHRKSDSLLNERSHDDVYPSSSRRRYSYENSRSRSRTPPEPEPKEQERDEFDLNLELHPLMHFIEDKPKLLKEATIILRGKKLAAMIPPVFAGLSQVELETLCLDELETLNIATIANVIDGKLVNAELANPKVENKKKKISVKKIKRKLKEVLTKEGPVKKRKSKDEGAVSSKVKKVKKDKKRKKKKKKSKESKDGAPVMPGLPPQKTLMELLELEYRAKAIKALLKSQDMDTSRIDDALLSQPSEVVEPTVIPGLESKVIPEKTFVPETLASSSKLDIVLKGHILVNDGNCEVSSSVPKADHLPEKLSPTSNVSGTDIILDESSELNVVVEFDEVWGGENEEHLNFEPGIVSCESEEDGPPHIIPRLNPDKPIEGGFIVDESSELDIREEEEDAVSLIEDEIPPESSESEEGEVSSSDSERDEPSETKLNSDKIECVSWDESSVLEIADEDDCIFRRSGEVPSESEEDEPLPLQKRFSPEKPSTSNISAEDVSSDESTVLEIIAEDDGIVIGGNPILGSSSDESDTDEPVLHTCEPRPEDYEEVSETENHVDGDEEDDEDLNPRTWFNRWYNSKKVQKNVKSNRVIGKLRSKLRREKVIPDPPPPEPDEATVPIIGSIGEYHSLFSSGKYKRQPETNEQLPESVENVVEGEQMDEDEDEENEGDDALWGDILG